jgi:hypothetical protein
MSVPLPASEVAVGDYSPDYGTVEKVTTSGESTTIVFVNGDETVMQNDEEIIIDQGGRFDSYRNRV